MEKAVRGLSHSLIKIRWNPDFRSTVENHFAPPSAPKVPSGLGRVCLSGIVTSFSFL